MTEDASPTSGKPNEHPCGLLRRLAAIFYDVFLLFAILMLATLIVVAPLGDAVRTSNIAFQLYLLVVSWAYFAVSWRGGQTVGMRAWRIHIRGKTQPISWTDTVMRFLVSIVSWAALGLGFLWSLFHPQRATWHDLASSSRLIVLPREKQDSQQSQK